MPIRPNASLDAVVVGSGVNGLAAAITLARAGRSVRVYEQQSTIGGSARSMSLTAPGFVHDWGATVQAMVQASPFFRSIPLDANGLNLVYPDAPFAHPLADGTATIVERSVRATADQFMSHDAASYKRIFTSFVEHADDLMSALLRPVLPTSEVLAHPLLLARFGLSALQGAQQFATRVFRSEQARSALSGVAAHSMLSLDQLGTMGYTLALITSAHAYGWPVAQGGSQQLVNAMVTYLSSLGGEVVTDFPVRTLGELPPSRVIMCDTTPKQLLQMAGDAMPSGYASRVSQFQYGAGVFKMDWALNAPVPWRNAACARAGTVHIGGTLAEIALSERDVIEGRHPEHPYVLAVQATLFDATRAPRGQHTLWAYCHVPSGSSVDMQQRIENQIERFAPGFRDCIVARSSLNTVDLERGNANIIAGNIASGAGNIEQVLARPVFALDPYATALKGVYLCSSSTPPGVGVHGMCGFNAARSALTKSFKLG